MVVAVIAMGVLGAALLAVVVDRLVRRRVGWFMLLAGGGAFAALSPASEAGRYQMFLIGCFVVLVLIVYAGLVTFGLGRSHGRGAGVP